MTNDIPKEENVSIDGANKWIRDHAKKGQISHHIKA